MDSRADQHWEYDIEVLSKWLRSLQITEEASEWSTEYMDKMLIAPVNKNNVQAELPKNIVLDSEWFDGDKIKFEDW